MQTPVNPVTPPADQRSDQPATAAGLAGVPPVPAEHTNTAPDGTGAAPRKSGLRVVRDVVETVLIAVLLYVGVRAVVLPYEVDGASMQPNLANHERVLVNRLAYWQVDLNAALDVIPGVDRSGTWIFTPLGDLERGDVVVLQPPVSHDQPYIKRVIGLPGDHVTFRDGYVYINGERLEEDYIAGAITGCSGSTIVATDTCDVVVPAGSVYVLGDNRENSSDSRYFGVVSIDDIEGKAFFSNWPLDRLGPIGHGDYAD